MNATQIVLGASRRKPGSTSPGPASAPTVARDSGDLDVHIVTHDEAAKGRGLPVARGSLGRAGAGSSGWLAVGRSVLPALLLTVALVPVRDQSASPTTCCSS